MSKIRVLLTREQVGQLCPSCADRMLQKGLRAVWFEVPTEEWETAVRKASAESYEGGEDGGFFTHCMEEIAPKANVDNPAAFCAWLHHKLLGRWPAEDKKHEARKSVSRAQRIIKAFVEGGVDVGKPFAGFRDWDECMEHMTKPKGLGGGGYDEETAKKVCGALKRDFEGKGDA